MGLNKQKTEIKRRFTLKQKLLLNALINISLMLLIGFYALNQMKLIGIEIEEIAEIDMPLIRIITKIETHQLEQTLNLERLLRLGSKTKFSPLTLQEYANSKAQFYLYGAKVKEELLVAEKDAKADIELAHSNSDKKEFEYILEQLLLIDKQHIIYQEHAIKIIFLVNAVIEEVSSGKSVVLLEKEKEKEKELEQLITKIEREENTLNFVVEQLLEEIEKFTQQSLTTANQHEKSAIQQILFYLIFGILLALVGAIVIIRQITIPVNRLNDLAIKIAVGDLSESISQPSNDEIGDLGQSINALVSTLNQTSAQAEAIAADNFSVDIIPQGEQDKLGHALKNMKNKIIERSAILAEKVALNDGIVNTSSDGILTIDEQGGILSCNNATQKLFQYQQDELLGKNIKMLMPMPYTAEHDSYLGNYKNSGIKKIIGSGREVQALKKDGTSFPIALSVGEVKATASGKAIYTGFIRDITKDKQSEADLKANNDELNKENARKTQLAKMNELTQGASDINQLSDDIIANLAKLSHAGHGVIYIVNQDNKLKLAGSYAFRERKNILAEIAVGEGLVGQCAKEKKVILLTKVPSDYIEINSALGEQVPLNLLLLPVLFEQKVMAVIELASFELFSQEQQGILIQIAQNLGVVINNIFNQQRTQQLLLATQQQSEELQTQQEELKSANENLTQQTQELQASEEELKQQSEELKVSNEELELRQADLQNQKDKISLAKQELEIKAEELALASKYKSEFLANMSHELRTPLNSLLLLSKALADNANNHLDATEVEDAQIIYQGGQSLLALINDILDLSKVEAGKLNIHIETINFTEIKDRLMQLFTPLAKNRKLSLDTIIDEKLPLSFHTDSQRLEQILRNLVSNAIKFTEMGGVTINFCLAEANVIFRNSNLSHDNCFVIHVSDTGVGISEDKLQAIFEAFQQEDGSTSRKYGGTGLGLTIARELSYLLGGEIQLSSTLGQGSCFSLYLPLSIEQQGSSVKALNTDNKSITKHDIKVSAGKLTNAKDDSSYSQHALPAIKPLINTFIDDDRLTISAGDKILLVVDDDEVFAKILRDHARRSGYKCLVAGDGLTGIELAKHYQPQGVILDIMLPDIDGHQVLERLKADDETRHIPVEIISAHSDDRSEALSQGAIGIQTKPVSSEQLQQVLIDIENMAKAKIKQILIIEDNKHHSKATRRLLENIGLFTHCVTSGEDGYQAILTGKYDCVILDLGLPDISGIELLDKLNKNKNKIKAGVLPPVIIYTGKEITDQEQAQLDKYSATIVIKGVGSAERLLDDISLFLHQIERDINPSHSNKNKVNMHLLHDENNMLADRKILLVDDDMRNTYALSKQLIDIGFDVDMANNGQEAIDLLAQQDDFELILMDTMMPIMDGNQATRKIRKMKNYANIPIIALTAKTMPEDRENALQAGASEYLTKPLDLDKLLSIMRIWLFKKTS